MPSSSPKRREMGGGRISRWPLRKSMILFLARPSVILVQLPNLVLLLSLASHIVLLFVLMLLLLLLPTCHLHVFPHQLTALNVVLSALKRRRLVDVLLPSHARRRERRLGVLQELDYAPGREGPGSESEHREERRVRDEAHEGRLQRLVVRGEVEAVGGAG